MADVQHPAQTAPYHNTVQARLPHTTLRQTRRSKRDCQHRNTLQPPCLINRKHSGSAISSHYRNNNSQYRRRRLYRDSNTRNTDTVPAGKKHLRARRKPQPQPTQTRHNTRHKSSHTASDTAHLRKRHTTGQQLDIRNDAPLLRQHRRHSNRINNTARHRQLHNPRCNTLIRRHALRTKKNTRGCRRQPRRCRLRKPRIPTAAILRPKRICRHTQPQLRR